MHLAIITQQVAISHFSAFLLGVIFAMLFLLVSAFVDWLRDTHVAINADTDHAPHLESTDYDNNQ